MANKANIRGETVWLLNDPRESSDQRFHAPLSAMPGDGGRNPAVALSLSLWVWGGGQFYNRQWQLGFLYFLFMINFYLFPSVIIHYWTPISTGLA